MDNTVNKKSILNGKSSFNPREKNTSENIKKSTLEIHSNNLSIQKINDDTKNVKINHNLMPIYSDRNKT